MNEKPKWLIGLVGATNGEEDRDLKCLAEHFGDRDLKVEWLSDRNEYVLSWEAFDDCNDVGTVIELAKSVVAALNGAMKAKDPYYTPIRRGASYQKAGDVYNLFIEVREVMQFRDSVSVAGGAVAPETTARDYFELAWQHDDARELLEYLAYPDQGWVTLYWVYEVLCRVKAHKTQGVEAEMVQFRNTANDRRLGGDRHAEWPATIPVPPTIPMTLDDAQSLLYGVAKVWLDSL